MSTQLLAPTSTVQVGSVTVVPTDGFVELDETQVYVTAEYTIPLTTDDDVDLIDPRVGIRTTITLNDRAFNLGVRERGVSHDRKSVTIIAASDEALLGEYAQLVDDTAPVAMIGSVRSVVAYVLGKVIPGTVLETTPNPDAVVAEVDALTWKAGTTAWDFLIPITAAASLRLFCDEQRRWRLVETSYMVPGTVTAQASNSRTADDIISRDGEAWVTGVVIRYRWTASDGESRERIDAAGDPGKVNVYDVDGPYPGPGFAQARLYRLRGQGRTQSATAIANYHETPSQEARFSLPGTNTQVGRVQRVRWGLLDGFVDIGARELTEIPPSAWLFLPSGEAWEDSPIGESWIEEVV